MIPGAYVSHRGGCTMQSNTLGHRIVTFLPIANIRPDDACPARKSLHKMSMFRAKKLDLGCFVNIKVIRDHTKRKVYEKHEAERYVRPSDRTKATARPIPTWLPGGKMERQKRTEANTDNP